MKPEHPVHDVIAIGLGPFDLGLLALAEPLDLDVHVLESRDAFSWHPGMMVEGATIQVPFLADLVSMADPTSRYSFLNYLKTVGRLYPFYIRESFNPLRREYDAYCRWAADELQEHISFGHHVESLRHDEASDLYEAVCRTDAGTVVLRGRAVVVGVGTSPHLPEALADVDGVVHTAEYLENKQRLVEAEHTVIVGSGQSAAETFVDLLGARGGNGHLTWLTRSPRFFPMEYTKLTLEMTSPDYLDHFHGLPEQRRDEIVRTERHLYKGISSDLVDSIHEMLYEMSLDGPPPVTLATHIEVTAADRTSDGRIALHLRHDETGDQTTMEADAVLAGTGYRSTAPALLQGLPGVTTDAAGRPQITRDYAADGDRHRVFVQNAEEHTHFLTAPDLGMAAYRNSVILRSLMGREVYPVEERIAFQTFGLPA